MRGIFFPLAWACTQSSDTPSHSATSRELSRRSGVGGNWRTEVADSGRDDMVFASLGGDHSALVWRRAGAQTGIRARGDVQSESGFRQTSADGTDGWSGREVL